MPAQIRTDRLRLVATSSAIERAAAAGPVVLARALAAEVASEWPPPLATDVLGYWADPLENDPMLHGWAAWYWLLVRANEPGLLVGYGGFKGRPDDEGSVEVGYAVLASYQRRGLATEAVRGLVEWAFAHAEVECVRAHTLPTLGSSLRVLEKLEFVRIGLGREEGTLLFERRR